MAKQSDGGKLWTLRQVAKEIDLHRSEVTGILKGLGIVPRPAGNSLVISSDELRKTKEAAERAKIAQLAQPQG